MGGAFLNTIINLWVPSKAENLLTKSATISFSRSNVHGVNHQQSCFFGNTATLNDIGNDVLPAAIAMDQTLVIQTAVISLTAHC